MLVKADLFDAQVLHKKILKLCFIPSVKKDR